MTPNSEASPTVTVPVDRSTRRGTLMAHQPLGISKAAPWNSSSPPQGLPPCSPFGLPGSLTSASATFGPVSCSSQRPASLEAWFGSSGLLRPLCCPRPRLLDCALLRSQPPSQKWPSTSAPPSGSVLLQNSEFPFWRCPNGSILNSVLANKAPQASPPNCPSGRFSPLSGAGTTHLHVPSLLHPCCSFRLGMLSLLLANCLCLSLLGPGQGQGN